MTSECGSVGVGCSSQGSSVAIHSLRKCFQCGGCGCGSNFSAQRRRQLARTADHRTKPNGEEREREGIESRISSGSSVEPSSG